MKDIATVIIDAMNNVISNRLNKLNYLYHIKAKIKSHDGNGNYIGEYAGQDITLMNPNNISVQNGDVVDVLYSNVDPNYRVIHFKY